MKKHKLLLTLGTVAAVAAPIAAVVSCGSGSTKAKTKEETKSGAQGGTGTQAGSQAGTTVAGAVNTGTIQISQPTVRTYSSADIETGIFNHISASLWAAAKFDVYKVTLPGTQHVFNFAFDQAAHYSEAEAKHIIETWASTANYGYGILTTENIFITTMEMGSAGWGGAAKDILVATKDLATLDALAKSKEMQVTFNTLLHEYGHHETSSLIDSNGNKQASALLNEGVIGTQMLKNVTADVSAETQRLTNLMTGKTLETYYEQFFGKQEGSIYSFHAADFFDLAYHFLDKNNGQSHLEFLNRAMNNLELMPLDSSKLGGFYGFMDLLKYQIGETNKILNDDKTYTQAAQDLVTAYGKYVYGYASFGLQATNWALKGFTADKFDFVKATDVAGNVFTPTVEKITSHYVTKDRLFADARIVNNSTAVNAQFISPTASAYEIKSVEFFEDTNHDGVLSEGDAKVNVNFTITK